MKHLITITMQIKNAHLGLENNNSVQMSNKHHRFQHLHTELNSESQTG